MCDEKDYWGNPVQRDNVTGERYTEGTWGREYIDKKEEPPAPPPPPPPASESPWW